MLLIILISTSAGFLLYYVVKPPVSSNQEQKNVSEGMSIANRNLAVNQHSEPNSITLVAEGRVKTTWPRP